MQPRAVLVLYEPGLKFKNSKYLLSLGVNIVGNDTKCQVHINSKAYFPEDYVASFYVTDQFMYIEALCDNMVQFKSNMQVESSGRKKDVYRYIDKNCRYVLQMEEIFYIGPYKAIVQVQAPHELRQIKNVVNLENFETPGGDDEAYGEEKVEIQMKHAQGQKIEVEYEIDAMSDGTEKIESQNEDAFAPTLEINEYDPYAYEPTLLIDDDKPIFEKKYSQNNNLSVNYAYEPKSQAKSPIRSPMRSPYRSPLINPLMQPQSQQSYTKSMIKKPKPNSQFSDKSMLSRQKQKKIQHFSQQVLYETIKKDQVGFNKQKNNSPQQDEEDISMPDTIKDSQEENILDISDEFDMPPTINDDQMPPTINDHQLQSPQDIEMPSTINDEPNPNSVEKKPKISKTMHQKKQSKPSLQSKHLYKSQKMNKSHEDQFQDDILGLFGKSDIRQIDSNDLQINDEKKQTNQKKQNNKKSLIDSNDFLNFKNQRVLPHVSIEEFHPSNNMVKSNASINPQKEVKNNQMTQKKSVTPLSQENSTSNFGKKRLFKESQKPKLVNLAGFKPKAEDKLVLRQRGFQIVSDGKSQEYDLLIIDQSKEVSQKIMMGILLDKWMVTEEWLKDKKWEEKKEIRIEGTIQGISWEIVDKQRGRRDIFTKAGIFYFTESLKELGRVFEFAGGNRTDELNIRKKLSCVINCAVEEDEKFYKQNKSRKNWKFYSHRLIGQSILLGEVPFKKYIVDETSF